MYTQHRNRSDLSYADTDSNKTTDMVTMSGAIRSTLNVLTTYYLDQACTSNTNDVRQKTRCQSANHSQASSGTRHEEYTIRCNCSHTMTAEILAVMLHTYDAPLQCNPCDHDSDSTMPNFLQADM